MKFMLKTMPLLLIIFSQLLIITKARRNYTNNADNTNEIVKNSIFFLTIHEIFKNLFITIL